MKLRIRITKNFAIFFNVYDWRYTYILPTLIWFKHPNVVRGFQFRWLNLSVETNRIIFGKQHNGNKDNDVEF